MSSHHRIETATAIGPRHGPSSTAAVVDARARQRGFNGSDEVKRVRPQEGRTLSIETANHRRMSTDPWLGLTMH
jgi:hypothetical protein